MPLVDLSITRNQFSTLRGRDGSNSAFWFEYTEVDEPCGRVELGVDGVDAVVVRVALLRWFGFKNDKADDRLYDCQ